MKRHLKNFLIPHAGNDHRPHMLRRTGALALAALIVTLFGFSVLRGLVLNQQSRFTAAVLPIVLVSLTNDDRSSSGLGELAINPVLEEAARLKAQHMAEHEYFAHVSPDGLDPWYWFYRAGYVFTEAGENLAVNFSDSEDVVEAWMNSPGHRANIMNGKFTEIGIAAVKGKYKNKSTVFVVQMFGAPAKVAVVPTPLPTASAIAAVSPASAAAQGTVAGAATEAPALIPDAKPLPPAPAEIPPEPPTELVKEEMSARVEGAIETAPSYEGTPPRVSPLASLAARPRAVVSWAYLTIGLLISFVIMLMVYKRVHAQHPRSMVYGCALLILIALLTYFNYLLLSSDLIIA